MKFVDQIKILLSSGQGGAGCVSFRKEPFYPRGGPNGGNGGRGGHVYFEVTSRVSSLFQYKGKRLLAADKGDPGQSNNKTGKDGRDLYISVPAGTIVKDSDGNVLKDLDQYGETLFLEGGRGGKGNTFFKTSVNQAPTHAQPGEEGQELSVIIELKMIADIGIIGFPNAGKSTLISSLTAAKPQIADYPFTTLNPQLGVIKVSDDRSIVLADIPGLIEGAHSGQGLGHKFLKHIERTKCFVHLIDVSGFSQRDPWEDYVAINNELSKYDDLDSHDPNYKKLSERKQIVVLNKIDSCSPEQVEEVQMKFAHNKVETLKVSGVTRHGLDKLVESLCEIIF